MKKEYGYGYKYWGKFWDEFEFIIEKYTRINGNSQMKKSNNNNQKALELSQRKNKIEEKSVLLPTKISLALRIYMKVLLFV